MASSSVGPLAPGTAANDESAPVQQLVSSMQLSLPAGGVDLTGLSAMPYINMAPGGGLDVLNAANLQAALQQQRNSAAPSAPAGADAALLSAATAPFLARIGTLASASLSTAMLVECYYTAARDVFVELLLRRTPGSTEAQRQAVRADADKAKADHPWTDAATPQDLARLPSLAAAVLPVPPSIVQQAPAAKAAFVQVVLVPWVTVAVLDKIGANPHLQYTTRAYARYALVQLTAVTLGRLAGAHDPAQPQAAATIASLQLARRAVLGMFNGAVDPNDVGKDVQQVLGAARESRQRTAEAAVASAQLRSRVGLTSDLQASFNADAQDVSRARWQFAAWVTAAVAVVLASAFLIAKDKLTLFVLLALPAALLVVADMVLRTVRSRRSG